MCHHVFTWCCLPCRFMRLQGKLLMFQFPPTLYHTTKWRVSVKPWSWKNNRRCLFSWASSTRGLTRMVQPVWMGSKRMRYVCLVWEIYRRCFIQIPYLFFLVENIIQILANCPHLSRAAVFFAIWARVEEGSHAPLRFSIQRIWLFVQAATC